MASTINKLSDTAIKAATPKDKPYKLSDGEGLYLEVMPNGSKYWRLKYRYTNKEKRLALGVYPEISLKDARKAKIKKREMLSHGIDPSENRREENLIRKMSAANSFEAVALEWFEKQKARKWKTASYTIRVERMLKKNLFPWLGHRPINEIKPTELLAVLRRTESKGIIETAHRVKKNDCYDRYSSELIYLGSVVHC